MTLGNFKILKHNHLETGKKIVLRFQMQISDVIRIFGQNKLYSGVTLYYAAVHLR